MTASKPIFAPVEYHKSTLHSAKMNFSLPSTLALPIYGQALNL